jgi:hypothetical protein
MMCPSDFACLALLLKTTLHGSNQDLGAEFLKVGAEFVKVSSRKSFPTKGILTCGFSPIDGLLPVSS